MESSTFVYVVFVSVKIIRDWGEVNSYDGCCKCWREEGGTFNGIFGKFNSIEM